MNIAFRLDATNEIGSGHFTRCMTLANALRKEGHKTKFFFREIHDIFVEKLQNNGHNFHCIKQNNMCPGQNNLQHSKWLKVSQEADASAFKHENKGHLWDWIIVDHYALDYRWETEVLEFTKRIMVIDDLADRKHNCHILLDQNFTDKEKGRYKSLTPDNCKILLGPKQALLRPEYSELHKKTRPREMIKTILISFGGADNKNVTSKTIEALLKMDHSNYDINIIAPVMSDKLKTLTESINGFANIQMLCNLPSLGTLLSKTDLAIGAIGTTSWERLCLGVPTIAITTGENQVSVAKALHNANLIHLLGEARDVSEDDILKALNWCLNNQNIKKWSKHCMSICDGLGTNRVVQLLNGFF